MQTVLFIGPSGSGKDTQVDFLVKENEFENIGTGEMFRKMYEQGDLDGIKAHQFWSSGKFVPNDLTYRMFSKWVKQFDETKSWAFVGVVRDPNQIILLDGLLKENNRKLDKVVHFTLSEESAIERMSLRRVCTNCGSTYHEKYKPEKVSGYCDKCGMILARREDDQPERIKLRLREYNNTIQPILNQYTERGVLVEIDASPSIDQIHNEVKKALGL